jgi:phosphopantothenate synthetase
MLSLSRLVPALLVILVAFSATRIMASSRTIAHSYILSLNADVAASARDSIVEALKQNGAKVSFRLTRRNGTSFAQMHVVLPYSC